MSQSFLALGVSTPVVRALDSLQIHHPFAVQQLVLPDALAGLDILAESPTGSGKTLAFGLPLVERTVNANGRPAALVLVPTRELATQVAADLRPLAEAKGLRVATVYGGVPLGAQAKKAKGAHVLVATPGRLHDLMERRMIALDGIRVLVLDGVMVTGDDVTAQSHDLQPTAGRAAARRDPGRCAALEDTPNGAASATAAGAGSIAVPPLLLIPPAPGRVIAQLPGEVNL